MAERRRRKAYFLDTGLPEDKLLVASELPVSVARENDRQLVKRGQARSGLGRAAGRNALREDQKSL